MVKLIHSDIQQIQGCLGPEVAGLTARYMRELLDDGHILHLYCGDGVMVFI